VVAYDFYKIAKKAIKKHIQNIRNHPAILDQVNGEDSEEYINSYNSVILALNAIKNDAFKKRAIQYLVTQEEILENELHPLPINGGKRKTHGTKKTASRKRVNKKRASNKKRGTQKRK
jgi:hypothetical protein